MKQKLSKEERIELILIFGKITNMRKVAAEFNARHPERPPISHTTVSKLMVRFRETGSVHDRPKIGRPKHATGDDSSVAVLAEALLNPHKSTRCLGAEAGISAQSVHRILKANKFYSHKFIKPLAQPPHDPYQNASDKRVEFCTWALNRCYEDVNFPRKVLFGGHSLFHLNGSLISQTYCKENPCWLDGRNGQVIVWCGILDGHLIGPFFFDGYIDSDAFLDMLGDSLLPELSLLSYNPENIWFLQEVGHYSVSVRMWLDENFPLWIGRQGGIEGPPESPDLTPHDFILWAYLKSQVFASTPANLAELKQRIEKACKEIDFDMLINVREEWKRRLGLCVAVNGGYIEHLI